MSNFVYILHSERLSRFYIGSTQKPVVERLGEHNSVLNKNSYSSKGQPWVLYYTIACESKSQALSIEKHIKRMKSKVYTSNLKRYPQLVDKLKFRYS